MAEARLARCPRCKAYTLLSKDAGLLVAVDIAPAGAPAFGVAVARGVWLYWVKNEPGRPVERLDSYSGHRQPTWGAGGAQTGTTRLHVEHSCGAPARDQVIVNVTSPKGSAPATPGNPEAGSLRPAAHGASAGAKATPSPAPSATLPPSEILGRCGICGRQIRPGEIYWSITHGHLWIDGEHEDCP